MTKRNICVLLVSALLTALVTGAVETHAMHAIRPPTQSAQLISKLDAYIAKTLSTYQVPGVAVAVVQDDKVTLLKGYGVRAAGQPGAVDANTIFQLASNSKPFTAAAAGLLVDEGKLAWDDRVIKHMPEFMLADMYATREMTLRDLLAMRTGLPQFTGDILGPFGYNRAQIMSRLRWLQPAYSLREKAQYSNIGFLLAGEMVARVAGSPWEDVVQTRLIEPLGMTRTGALFSNLKRDGNIALSHAIVNGKVRLVAPDDVDAYGAAGSVSSTATDMARWLRMLLGKGTLDGKTILKSETVAEMFKRSMVSDIGFDEAPPISEDTGFFYGLGWGSYDYAGHHIIEKGGALAGVRTVVTLIPNMNMGIVVLSNLNIAELPEAVRAQFIHLALGTDPAADDKAIFDKSAQTEKMFAPPTPPVNPGKFNGSLDALVGTYENAIYGPCTILKQADALTAECGPARYRGQLNHWNNGAFALTFPGATSGVEFITFTIGEDGTADSFTSDALGLFTRVQTKAQK